jgi:hypothetical protein
MPKTSKNAADKKRGRPAGQSNYDYESAVAIPAVCPRCGSATLVAVKGAKPLKREIGGKLPTGFEYSAIEWQRSICTCGQRVTVRTYLP